MKQNHNYGCRRLAAALLTAALLCLTAAPSLAAEEPRVLRVAFPETEGYTMTSPDGKHSGLVVDFLNEIAKYTGWKYEYVPMSSDDILDRFTAGEADLMGGQYYMEGVEDFCAYPDYNCGYSKLLLLARQDDGQIKSYDLNSFNGKTIGVFERARENIRRLQIYLELNNLDCTLRYYTYEELHAAGDMGAFLERGDVDLILSSGSSISEAFHTVASFDSQPPYIVTQPGNQEILDDLNMALRHIYEANPAFAQQIYERNFSTAVDENVLLNEEELAFVAETGAVTVAMPRYWHPMVCLDNSESHDGVAVDILRRIEAYSGLNFSYSYYDSYADALAALEQGEADVLGFYLGTEESAAKLGLALSTPYIELNAILVRNKNVSYPDNGLTGAVLEGRELPDTIIAEHVVTYQDITEALSDVNRGKVDFFYGISSLMERAVQENNFTNLIQVNLINDNQSIGFAVSSPAQPELLSILNKGVNSISPEDKYTISSRSMVSIGETKFTLGSIVYSNPALAITVVAVFLGLVVLAVLLVSRSRLHAASMRAELARAEADSRAKGEFLSRMSHELRTPMNAIVGLADLAGTTEDLPEKTRTELAKIKSSSHYLLSLINDILDMSRIESGKLEIASESFSLGGLLGDIQSMLSQEALGSGVAFSLHQEITDDVVVGDSIRLRQVLLNLLSNALKFTPAEGKVRLYIRQDSSTADSGVFTFRVTDTGVGISSGDQQRIFKSFEQLGSNYSKSRGTGLGLTISQSIVAQMGGALRVKSAPGKGSEFYFTLTLPKGQLPCEPEGEPQTDEGALHGVGILLAEDNDLNAEIAAELLRFQGARVTRAENGAIALRMFEQSQPGAFDCILMDIMMPEMDGLEATAAIRALARPDAKTIPIVAMTANAFQEDRDAALAAGMDGFVPKPIDMNLLFQELRRVLKAPQSFQ